MSLQFPPVCEFLCGPNDGSPNVIACLVYCQTKANCAVTPSVLYAAGNALLDNVDLFFTGVGSIVNSELSSLLIRMSLYQQLPWLIGFILIILLMAMIGLIQPYIAVLLIIVAVLVAGLFIYFSLLDVSNTIAKTSQDAISQVQVDYSNLRTRFNADPTPIYAAYDASQVPCGCTCSGLS